MTAALPAAACSRGRMPSIMTIAPRALTVV